MCDLRHHIVDSDDDNVDSTRTLAQDDSWKEEKRKQKTDQNSSHLYISMNIKTFLTFDLDCVWWTVYVHHI